eukprot:s33_g76.t1
MKEKNGEGGELTSTTNGISKKEQSLASTTRNPVGTRRFEKSVTKTTSTTRSTDCHPWFQMLRRGGDALQKRES